MTVFVIYKNLMNLSGILSLGKAYFSIRNFMKSGFCSILSEYTLSINKNLNKIWNFEKELGACFIF